MIFLTKKGKEIAIGFAKASLYSIMPIPFVVFSLHSLKYSQSTILIVSFLCSALAIEYFYFRERRNKNEEKLPSHMDVSYSRTDFFMYGAIAARIESDNLMNSLELSNAAMEVYEWSRLK